MDVHGVMHDFEWAMINSIEKWFKCDYHMGCFFPLEASNLSQYD